MGYSTVHRTGSGASALRTTLRVYARADAGPGVEADPGGCPVRGRHAGRADAGGASRGWTPWEQGCGSRFPGRITWSASCWNLGVVGTYRLGTVSSPHPAPSHISPSYVRHSPIEENRQTLDAGQFGGAKLEHRSGACHEP